MKLDSDAASAFETPQTALLRVAHERRSHQPFDAAFLAAVHPELYEGVQRMLSQLIAHALARLAATGNGDATNQVSNPAPGQRQPRVASVQVEPLSPREREVLEHIAAGDSNKQIASALDLSLHTVKRHVANILTKLGATSRSQAGAWLRAHH